MGKPSVWNARAKSGKLLRMTAFLVALSLSLLIVIGGSIFSPSGERIEKIKRVGHLNIFTKGSVFGLWSSVVWDLGSFAWVSSHHHRVLALLCPRKRTTRTTM